MRFLPFLIGALVAAQCFGATPQEFWPLESKGAQPSPPWPADHPLSRQLRPAIQFQLLFFKMLSADRQSLARPIWVAELRSFAQPEPDPVSAGVAEVARAWIARFQMAQIEERLRGFYKRNVRFPAALGELGLSAEIQNDPWGEPWSYSPAAPTGIPKLANQRFQLGPAHCPRLGLLQDSLGDRALKPPPWQCRLREVAGRPALQILSAAPALIQPGAKFEGYHLLYIGENWALWAGADQLFVLPVEHASEISMAAHAVPCVGDSSRCCATQGTASPTN